MKRRVISAFLAIMLLLTLTFVCFADGYGFIMSSKSDAYNVNKGDTFSVTFYVNSITHESGILGLDAKVFYDPSHLRLESLNGVYPEDWGNSGFIAYSEEDENGKKAIGVVMVYDGNDIMNIPGAKYDDTLGIVLTFTVITSSVTDTTIKIPEGENLKGTSGISGSSSPESLDGLGDYYTLSLNKNAGDSSEESSFDPFYSADPDQSYEEIASDEEYSSKTEESVYIPSTSSSQSDVSGESSEIYVEEEEEPTSEADENSDGSESVSQEESSEANEEEGGVNIILLIVIGCIAIAVIAVVVYIVKNKKDDMNPVNPG